MSLAEQVRSAAALVPSMTRIDAELMDAAPQLQLIVQFGAGLEVVDLDAARDRGIQRAQHDVVATPHLEA